jgi:hypothetical protein
VGLRRGAPPWVDCDAVLARLVEKMSRGESVTIGSMRRCRSGQSYRFGASEARPLDHGCRGGNISHTH